MSIQAQLDTLLARFLALVTTMVTKAGYQGWWLWLATLVTKELTMVTDSVARTFFLKIRNFRPKNHKNHEQKEKSSGNTVSNHS